MKKTALITGINGQDGSYLAELLLSKGYTVFGMEAPNALPEKRHNIGHILDKIELVQGDLLNETSLTEVMKKTFPAEVYNLAARSSVAESWKTPIQTGEVTALGAARLLESIRQIDPGIKFYQASSSEIFGGSTESPQNERTCPHPKSPYGIAKLYAHWMTVNYRETYKMFAVSGILFNHESPRRSPEFVTRKIVREAVRIKRGLSKELRLGNLDTKRDWGFAGDYVEAMWRMLQQEQPRDFVIGTGETHSVREFAQEAFGCLDLDWEKYVVIDQNFVRPAEVNLLVADATLAKEILHWEPKVGFKELVKMLVSEELKAAAGENV